jgi:hypothetical protein
LKLDTVQQNPFDGHRFNGYELRDVLFEALKTMPIDIEQQILAIEKFLQDRHHSTTLLDDVAFFFRKEHPLFLQFNEIAGWLSLAPAIDNIITNFSELKQFFSQHTFGDFFNNTRSLGYLHFISTILKKLPQNFELFEKNSKNIIGLMGSLQLAKTRIQWIISSNKETFFEYIPAAEYEPFEVEIKAFVEIFSNLIDQRLELYKEFDMLEWMTLSSEKFIEGELEEKCLQFFQKQNILVNSTEMKVEFMEVSFFTFRPLARCCRGPFGYANDSYDFLSMDERWSNFFKACIKNKKPYKGLLKLVHHVFSIAICADNAKHHHSVLQKNERWSIKGDNKDKSFVFQDALMLSSANMITMTQTKLTATLKKYKHLLE